MTQYIDLNKLPRTDYTNGTQTYIYNILKHTRSTHLFFKSISDIVVRRVHTLVRDYECHPSLEFCFFFYLLFERSYFYQNLLLVSVVCFFLSLRSLPFYPFWYVGTLVF